MSKTQMTHGARPENDHREPAVKRNDYRAPKLTVVGTVEELTQLIGNNGVPDGGYATGAGG